MRAKSGIEAPVEVAGRSPKPGVAGSNPAGGAQNLGPLARRSDPPPSICPIRGARFHPTTAPRRIVPRILLMPTGTSDANAAMEYRYRSRARNATLPATGIVPVTSARRFPGWAHPVLRSSKAPSRQRPPTSPAGSGSSL